ncbi:MAG: hypothetical protein ACRBDI_10305 [Alphaproteobacteria bacterium]
MEEDSKKLDAVLGRRSVPEMRSNLEYRIIQAAKAGRQVQKEKGFFAGLNAAIDEFFCGLALPKPAISMSVVLVLAIMTGVYSDNAFVPDLEEANNMAVYMDFEQVAGYGGSYE